MIIIIIMLKFVMTLETRTKLHATITEYHNGYNLGWSHGTVFFAGCLSAVLHTLAVALLVLLFLASEMSSIRQIYQRQNLNLHGGQCK